VDIAKGTVSPTKTHVFTELQKREFIWRTLHCHLNSFNTTRQEESLPSARLCNKDQTRSACFSDHHRILLLFMPLPLLHRYVELCICYGHTAVIKNEHYSAVHCCTNSRWHSSCLLTGFHTQQKLAK